MSWAKIDDLLPHHEKIVNAGSDAPAVFGLYVASICYAQRQKTDGRIPRKALALLLPGAPRPSRRLLEALVTLRLWDQDGDGWAIHDYLAHNLSAEERRLAEAANATRQAAYRDRLRNASRNASSNESGDASVTGPTPLLSSPLRSRVKHNPDSDGLSATPTRQEYDRLTAKIGRPVP